jgi:UDP-N-acetylglucosamine diphosphorylase / glucose-1-phosphate thymidylyltransferase / UDP-N-acetylgalactosamine diphosphorylase / glucosamine-1-phosphate N-acetyltransferase / galactosamine-1-phosphate N-acetyltransferase
MIKLSDFLETKSHYFAEIFGYIDKPWDVLERIEEFITKKGPNLKDFKEIRGNVFTAEGVVIETTAKIQAPALIGKNSKIGPGVLIREGVIIGDNCNIGHGSEVKHSILGNKTNLAHLNYVGDSIVGSQVNIAAGTVLANYKNGAKDLQVYVDINGKKVNTGLNKFGAILGDGVKLGSNVVTNPGTIIGKNTLVYPLAPIFGTIPANKIVKYKPQLEIVDKE